MLRRSSLVARRSSLVARRSSLVARRSSLVAAVLFLGVPTQAGAISLSPGAHLGVTRAYPGNGANYEQWTVWARRTDGHLAKVRENPVTPTPVWQDLGMPYNNSPVGSQGVVATGWTVGGTTRERVYYVTQNRVVEIGVDGGTSTFMTSYAAPGGATLTGYLAASQRVNAQGTRVALVYATVTPSAMWVLTIDPGVGPTWQQIDATGTISTSAPLAASQTADGVYSRVFYVTTSNTVKMRRWNGAAWDGPYTVGQPPAVPVCGSMAAAEGDSASSSGHRIYLFCTKKSAQNEAKLRYAYASKVGGTSFTWGSRDLGVDLAQSGGYAVAATPRPEAGATTIDAFVLTTSSKLYHLRHQAGHVDPDALVVDLGADGETVARQGALAATPAQPGTGGSTGYSYAYFLGPVANAGRLYRRAADPLMPAASPASWLNHGSSESAASISPSASNTENATAIYKGKVVTAAIVMTPYDPGIDLSTAYQHVEVRFSTNDGENWQAPYTPPTFLAAPPGGSAYASDPTVDFDDSGTGWISLFGIQRTGNCWSTGGPQTDVYYVTTADGVNYSAPIEIEARNVDGSGASTIDHPWLAIYRNPNGDDRVNVVWEWNGNLRLATKIGNAAFSIATLNREAGGAITGAAVPVITIGASGATYIAWGGTQSICRLDTSGLDAFTRCEDDQAVGATNETQHPNAGTPDARRLIFTDADEYINTIGMWSWVASPTDPDKLYYAFQRAEAGDVGHLDAWFEEVSYDANAGTAFSFSIPRLIAQNPADDGTSQWGPELTVSRDGAAGETIFASWYDSRNPSSAGDCANMVDRCYEPRRSVSFDALNFLYDQRIPIDAAGTMSDPALLPTNCRVGADYLPNHRFLGDFHHVTGDLLHSWDVVIGSPAGGLNGTGHLRRSWVSKGFWWWP